MVNPWQGEVAIVIDGQKRVMKLTLGALAGLEEALGAGSLIELVERFEAGRFSTRDVLLLIAAGLRGGGWPGGPDDLVTAEIAGGMLAAIEAAGRLLGHAFGGASGG